MMGHLYPRNQKIPKICSHFLARARKELTTRSRIGSVRRLSGNLSTFDAKERNSENNNNNHNHQQQQQQKESKKKNYKPTHTYQDQRGIDILTAPPSYSNLLGFDIMQRNTTIPCLSRENSSWVNPAFMKKLIRACLPTTSDTNLEKLHYVLLHVHSTCTANKSSCLHVPPNKGMKNGRAQDTLIYMMFRRRSEMSPRNSPK